MMIVVLAVEAKFADLHLYAGDALEFGFVYQGAFAAVALEGAVVVHYRVLAFIILFNGLLCFPCPVFQLIFLQLLQSISTPIHATQLQ